MTKILSAFTNYIKASIEELRKVAWPSRTETVRYSLLVIGISVGTAAFIGILDYFFTLGIEKLVNLVS